MSSYTTAFWLQWRSFQQKSTYFPLSCGLYWSELIVVNITCAFTQAFPKMTDDIPITFVNGVTLYGFGRQYGTN